MFIKELALPISIYPNIRIQPNNLTAPHSLPFSSYHIPQPTLLPERLSKLWVGDLETVIDPDSFANLGLPRGRSERDGLLEEGQVRVAERRRKQLWNSDDLGTEHGPQLQINGRDKRR